ncbi:hypothetical protein JOF53_004331 [Crossiella equi]|uniref:Uncharacterized protein n=1 Tax=Crossiella equi TaxID=130796 RepID=A0ABS5AFV0_9PSEU|nr:hypothetical protein [Crossiella equi]MBP2475459.1 hypothetical protein [Crossiella equi]
MGGPVVGGGVLVGGAAGTVTETPGGMSGGVAPPISATTPTRPATMAAATAAATPIPDHLMPTTLVGARESWMSPG